MSASGTSSPTPQEWRRFLAFRGLRLGCLAAPLVAVGVSLSAWLLAGDLVGGGMEAGGALLTAFVGTSALAMGLGLVAALLTPLAYWLGAKGDPPDSSWEELRAREPFARPLPLLLLVGLLVGLGSAGVYALEASLRQPPSERAQALERVAAGEASSADLELDFDLIEVLRRLRELRAASSGDPAQLIEVLTGVGPDWIHAERIRAELEAWRATERLSPATRARVERWLEAK